MRCPSCGSKMILRQTTKFFHKDGTPKSFYGCTRYPYCKETHSANKDGSPMGIPVDEKGRKARKEAHAVFDELWKEGYMSRSEAYRWLAKEMGREIHFSELSEEECYEVIDLINETDPDDIDHDS